MWEIQKDVLVGSFRSDTDWFENVLQKDETKAQRASPNFCLKVNLAIVLR